MIGTKCPGQDMRYWTADDVFEEQCPHCGNSIEFFKTDIRLRCPSCKTRVANPRFNMGCAEWCAYAEQCLGPGAKGLKSGSLKAIFIDELNKYITTDSNSDDLAKTVVEQVEKVCEEKRADILPVIASIIIIYLYTNGHIESISRYLESINEEHNLPQKALKDIETILASEHINSISNPEIESIKKHVLEVI